MNGPGDAVRAWREAERDGAPTREVTEPEETWILEEVRYEADRAASRARRSAPPARRRPTPAADHEQPSEPGRDESTRDELAREVGSRRAERLDGRLKDASRAFRRERYAEARQILRAIIAEAPGSSSARELLGLTYYRLGRWKEAARELEAFRSATGSTEQHPVLADCYRAQRMWSECEALWDELRAASPGAALVAEGRIVQAGSLADRGRLADAIALLDKGRWRVNNPREHHLRMAYVLADLYERSGDVALARQLFGWVAAADPDFADVHDRRRSLR